MLVRMIWQSSYLGRQLMGVSLQYVVAYWSNIKFEFHSIMSVTIYSTFTCVPTRNQHSISTGIKIIIIMGWSHVSNMDLRNPMYVVKQTIVSCWIIAYHKETVLASFKQGTHVTASVYPNANGVIEIITLGDLLRRFFWKVVIIQCRSWVSHNQCDLSHQNPIIICMNLRNISITLPCAGMGTSLYVWELILKALHI